MFVLYNMLQAFFLPVLSPFLVFFVLCKSKYRNRIPSRLGYGLKRKLYPPKRKHHPDQKTYWVHALSVGEVTSALPLVTGIKRNQPECRIIFSVTTKAGRKVADKRLGELVDDIIDSPLDILPVVQHFHKLIQPDYFILVETDFWPNLLLYLQQKRVPSILVNGRVSDDALAGYQRMKFFFEPIFKSFTALCMQTAIDKNKMVSMGVSPAKLHTLGNLKFDTRHPLEEGENPIVRSIGERLPTDRPIFIAGSTHPGEEQILLESYRELLKADLPIYMVIAPREPKRADEILEIAKGLGLIGSLRTKTGSGQTDFFILNTIGELAPCYFLGDISFVGGSLVKKGGHNPIEPAIMKIPVLFGPHMEDFSEISQDLIDAGGGHQVRNSQELSAILRLLLDSPEARIEQGLAAQQFVLRQQGVIQNHLLLIQDLN